MPGDDSSSWKPILSRWTKFFFFLLGVLLTLLGIVGFSVPETLRAESIPSGAFLGLLLVSYVAGFLGYALYDWFKWKEEFRVVTLARKLDPETILRKKHLMDQKFVPLSRTFITEQLPQGPSSQDPWSRMEEMLSMDDSKCGFLLEGGQAIGKTRFAAEWLKSHRKNHYVLVPLSRDLPLPHCFLRSPMLSKAEGVCLFLDQLETFKLAPDDLDKFVRPLQKWDRDYLVVATMKNGDESRRIRDDFELLLHGVLNPPTYEQMKAVAKAAKVLIPPRPLNENQGSFLFLIGPSHDFAKVSGGPGPEPLAKVIFNESAVTSG